MSQNRSAVPITKPEKKHTAPPTLASGAIMATLKQRSAAADKRRALEGRFDPEVIARMREEFDAADTDGSGEVDVHECAAVLGKLDGGRQSKAELQKSAANLLHQLDADRNGQIDFHEFCFRFGRRYQMVPSPLQRCSPCCAPGGRSPQTWHSTPH